MVILRNIISAAIDIHLEFYSLICTLPVYWIVIAGGNAWLDSILASYNNTLFSFKFLV